MGKLTSRGGTIDNWFSRATNGLTFYQALAPAGVVGIVTAYLGSTISWIASFGAFGWWVAGLCGFFATSASLAALGIAKEKRAAAKARERWAEQVDGTNPLDTDFTRKRLKISDIASPIDKRIANKRFTDCELMGPANIVLMNGGSLMGAAVHNCDICVVRDQTPIHNVIVFDACNILGGSIFGCTIFISDKMYADHFEGMGATSISYRKNEKVGD